MFNKKRTFWKLDIDYTISIRTSPFQREDSFRTEGHEYEFNFPNYEAASLFKKELEEKGKAYTNNQSFCIMKVEGVELFVENYSIRELECRESDWIEMFSTN